MHPKLIDYEAASNLIGVPRGTIASWVHRKEIPHVRLGPRLVRFDADELATWIAARRVGASK